MIETNKRVDATATNTREDAPRISPQAAYTVLHRKQLSDEGVALLYEQFEPFIPLAPLG